jgi:hypothetical protein
LAERTGLEPATPGVTGRYSNQLNYRSDLGCPLEDGGPYGPWRLRKVSRPQAALKTGRES